MVKEYQVGEKALLVVKWLSQTGEEATVTGTPTITIKKYDPSDDSWTTKVNAANMTQESGSTYAYEYDTTGEVVEYDYLVVYSAVVGGLTVYATETFRLIGVPATQADIYELRESVGLLIKYTSTLQLVKALGIKGDIPVWTVGSSPVNETVGTGDNSETTFYLDHNNVIAGSYTLYYGATEAAATALTETTHYTISKDNATITLTSAGVTLVSTNNIYAKYSYCLLDLPDSYLQTVLERAEQEVESRLGTIFADGTATTPDYTQVTNEAHDGKGKYDRDYYTKKYPLPDVSTLLDGDVAIGDTTLTVDSTNGFLSSGYLLIDSEKVTYSSKSSTTFTVTALTAAHDDGSTVIPFIVEISTTDSGTEPTWTVLSKDDDFDIDLQSGRVHIYQTDYDLTYYALQYPPRLLPNRFRITYIWGNDTIPGDIVRLVLIFAKRMLMTDSISKALVSGRNEFSPEMFNADAEETERIINKYKQFKIANV